MIAFEVFCHSIIYSRLVQHFFMIAPSNNHLKLFKLIRVSNATFNNISVIWWVSVILEEEIRIQRKCH